MKIPPTNQAQMNSTSRPTATASNPPMNNDECVIDMSSLQPQEVLIHHATSTNQTHVLNASPPLDDDEESSIIEDLRLAFRVGAVISACLVASAYAVVTLGRSEHSPMLIGDTRTHIVDSIIAGAITVGQNSAGYCLLSVFTLIALSLYERIARH